MRRYRLYIFDKLGRKVEEEREFQSADDQVAEDLAQGWRGTRKAELWCSDRQVKKWGIGARRL